MRNYLATRTALPQIILRACVVTCVILISACQQAGPTYHTQKDPVADFKRYHTFGFLNVNENVAPDAEVAGIFTQSLRDKMESLGYRYSETDPDLLIHYQANLQNSLEASGNAIPATVNDAGFHSHDQSLYRELPSTAETTHWSIKRSGAVRINVIDAEKMQTIWQGASEGSPTEDVLIQPKQPIEQLIDKLFKQFPRHK